MKILETQEVTLEFDSTIPCVDLIWQGFVPAERFRSVIEIMVEFIKEKSREYKHIQLFADIRKLGEVSIENVDWMAETIDPELYKCGVRKVSFIVPENAFTKVSLEFYTEKVEAEEGKLIPAQFFDSEEAKNWLKSIT